MKQGRGYINKINAHGAALWYRQPSKSVHVIMVAGKYAKTTVALLLASVLETGDKRVAVFTGQSSLITGEPYLQQFDTSAATVQAALAAAAKARVDYVIIEATAFVCQEHILKTIHYNSIVATSIEVEIAHMFDREVEYVALPYAEEPLEIPLAPHQIAYYGRDARADIYIETSKLRRGGSEITLVLDHHNSYDLATYLLGEANVENVAAAIAMAYILGIPTDDFAEGVARIETVANNFEHVKLDAPYRLYVDSAANSESLDKLITSARALAKRRLLVALDDGFSLDDAKRAATSADQVTIYSSDVSDGHIVLAKNLDDAVITTVRGARTDDSVLLVGRKFCTRDERGELDIVDTIKGSRFADES